MNGNNNEPRFNLGALEVDLSRITPLVREGFASAGPSPHALSRIHAEALRQTARKHGFWHRVRIVSLAASLALAVGGLYHLYLTEKTTPKIVRAETQIQITDEAAELLLSMQGLDADSFFNSEETESAWL